MYNWEGLAKKADRYVDHFWGVSVILTPMIRENEFKDASVDPSRQTLTTVAVPVVSKAEGAKAGESVVAVGAVYISIREEPVNTVQLQKGDRVSFKGDTYEVEMVSPSVVGRHKVTLLRVAE